MIPASLFSSSGRGRLARPLREGYTGHQQQAGSRKTESQGQRLRGLSRLHPLRYR